MAILKGLPGVEVTVTVNDKALTEYYTGNQPEQSATKLCYIIAQSNQTFEIEVRTDTGATRGSGLRYEINVDGKVSDSWVVAFCKKSKVDESPGWVTKYGHAQEYKFSEIEIVDSDAANLIPPIQRGAPAASKSRETPKELLTDAKEFGVIKVNVYHLAEITPTKKMPKEANFVRPAGSKQATLETLKGSNLSHFVASGETVPCRKKGISRFSDFKYMMEEPIAIFEFLYRSREILKQQQIIPRSPSPPPLEERAVSSLKENDISELQKELKALKEQLQATRKIKQEYEEENSRPRKAARMSEPSEVVVLD